jgi:hypothetical protein
VHRECKCWSGAAAAPPPPPAILMATKMATRTMIASPSHPLSVTSGTQAMVGVGAQAIIVAVRPGHLQRCRCCPPLLMMVSKMSSASPALLPLPMFTALPMSVAQFARMLLPSKMDMPGSTPEAISAAGTPAAQIASLTVPWPSSACYRSHLCCLS